MIKTKNIVADIPVTFLRFLQSRNEERVLEVVLVCNEVDRYDTIIAPDGMRTDPSTVTNDYNHKGVDTGAYLTNLRTVKNYEIEGINGKKQVLESALIAEAHVPETAEMFYFDKEGAKKSNGNLKKAIDDGHIKSVSVEFKPVRQKTDTRTGITTFTVWDLIRVSFLDVAPGQPYSGLKVLRYFDASESKRQDINETNKSIMPKAIHDAVNAQLSEQFETEVNVENLKLVTTFDYDGATHQFTVDYSEEGDITLSDFETLEEQESYDEEKMRALVDETVKKAVDEVKRSLKIEISKEETPQDEEAKAIEEAKAKRALASKPEETNPSPDKMQTQARALGGQDVQYTFTHDELKAKIIEAKLNKLNKS